MKILIVENTIKHLKEGIAFFRDAGVSIEYVSDLRSFKRKIADGDSGGAPFDGVISDIFFPLIMPGSAGKRSLRAG